MTISRNFSLAAASLLLFTAASQAEDLSLDQLKAQAGALSKYLSSEPHAALDAPTGADLEGFQAEIAPILEATCIECHGPDKQKAKFRVDKLDPDMVNGEDAEWWLEVVDVLSNGEMPPEDEVEMAGEDRGKVIDWLSSQIQFASQTHRAEQGHSSFRRMTRYEYNYALQDLLGFESDFAKNLPPEPVSEDGFQNSSETLQITASQYATYLEVSRHALERATVRGERPEELYWSVSADLAAKKKAAGLKVADKRTKTKADQIGVKGAHYKNLESGKTVSAYWSYRGADDAWEPTATRPVVSEPSEVQVVLPAGQRHVVELGDQLPNKGLLRVRVRASRATAGYEQAPSLALEFGWQGDPDQRASYRISSSELVIDAASGEPAFYQWEIPLDEIQPRNPIRGYVEMGAVVLTSPSEYIRLHNTSKSADIHLDYVEVSAPLYEQWPPASHQAIFIESENRGNETAYAREVVSHFMSRAWRRSVTEEEVDFQMSFYDSIRPACEDFE
ncbi:MAG: DUF1587 domain-containing protein [Luteolibacter sp.]